MIDDCVFCKIVVGEIPCFEVWQDDDHLAFLTRWPNTEGFTVVIPKKHTGSYLFDVESDVMHSTIDAAKTVAKLIDDTFDDVGRTGLIFEGFGVDHLHAKLVPMHGTGDMSEWQAINSETMRDFYETYPGYISSHDADESSAEALQKVADRIIKATGKRG